MECHELCLSNSNPPCTAFYFFKSNIPNQDWCTLYKGGPYTYGDGTIDGCAPDGCGPEICYVIQNGKKILKI